MPEQEAVLGKQIGVVMDPIHHIKPWKDSTLALLLEGARRGHDLWYMEPDHLALDGDRVRARMRPLEVRDDPHDWFTLGESDVRAMVDLDVIFMRQDPPVDMRYLHVTHLLEAAEREGVCTVNRPGAVRSANEKLYALRWPHLCPETRVSADAALLRRFVQEHGKAVLKPLDAMGGASIFVCSHDDPNLSVALETLTDRGRRYALAQQYLPEISEGDKRILLFHGEAYPYALDRIPAAGETRGNLAAGGTGRAARLTETDQRICDELGPTLKAEGLVFAGLDVIGGKLTEVNVTSPTCIREIDELFGGSAASVLFDGLDL